MKKLVAMVFFAALAGNAMAQAAARLEEWPVVLALQPERRLAQLRGGSGRRGRSCSVANSSTSTNH